MTKLNNKRTKPETSKKPYLDLRKGNNERVRKRKKSKRKKKKTGLFKLNIDVFNLTSSGNINI
jgi:hypothetical protein